ncbi:MAG: radical SAM-associated putative lipoprotein, partial [Acutalibacteraceae bacterium]|nr:radical SAM-associated putative lipoprotein [Acutalibacteraceae bacterium]
MRKRLLNRVNQVLAICLAILGVPGCKEPEVPMYGSPHATFTAEGNVTNETAEPIEGVKVTVDGCYQSG